MVFMQSINYTTQSVDTSMEVERIQFAKWRSLSLSQKAELVSSWTKGCWEMGLNAILSRYPDATYPIIRNKFAILTLGNTTAHWILAQNYQPPLMITDPISLALVITDILNQLEISYLVGGSLASSLLGELRSTQDIDLVVDLDLEKVPLLLDALEPRFYVSENAVREAIIAQKSFNIIDNESLGKVDMFILKDEPFSHSEFQRKQPRIIRPGTMLVLPTAEDIILQKLTWYKLGYGSEKQWRDILGVMKLQGEKLDLTYLSHWAENLGVLESLKRGLTQSGL